MNSRFEIQQNHNLPPHELQTNKSEPNESDANEEMSQEAGRMLDNYLKRACVSQDAIVSAHDQDELRKEMSGHILALAAAHQELGLCAEEAMQAALKQFGEAEQIGQAIGHEVGKRPSFLGSPHTVSMIGGLLSSWAVLSSVTFLLANTNLGVISAEAQLLGLVLGCITGSVIWKRRKSIREAALWNARFCAGMTALVITATFVYCCLFSGYAGRLFTAEWVQLAVPTLMEWIFVAGAAGACHGALTGLWCRLIRKPLTQPTLQTV